MKVARGGQERERERGNFFLGIVCLVWSLTNSSCSPSSFRKYKHEYCTHYISAGKNLRQNTTTNPQGDMKIHKREEKMRKHKDKYSNGKKNIQKNAYRIIMK